MDRTTESTLSQLRVTHEALVLMATVCGIAMRESASAMFRGEAFIAEESFREAVSALAPRSEELENMCSLFKLACEVAEGCLEEHEGQE